MIKQVKNDMSGQSSKRRYLQTSGDKSIDRAAKAAGIWYVLLVASSIFGGMLVDSSFFEPGAASAVIMKIKAGQQLYQLGIASFLAGQVCQIFVMLALYKLFQSVDRNQTRAMLAFVVVMVPVAFSAVLLKFAPLVILNDTAFLQAFEPQQIQALSMLFLELQNRGIVLLEIFWGLWLLPLGILVIKSDFFPRLLGILLIIGCAGHITSSFTVFIPDGIGAFISQIGNALSIGELPFFLWLIIFGAKNLVIRRKTSMETR